MHHSASARSLALAALYAFLLLAVGATLNLIAPYDPEPGRSLSLSAYLLWGASYLPLAVLPAVWNWRIAEFGFVISPRMLVGSMFLLAICTPMTALKMPSFQASLAEAFARTGEEIFFRGFLFLLAMSAFRKCKRPWLLAVLVTSVCFIAVHTQTFQSGYFSPEELSQAPHYALVLQRLLNLSLIATALGLLRHLTGSVLPGAIAHTALNAGIGAALGSLFIYAMVVVIARGRGEAVAEGFHSHQSPTGGAA